MHRTRLTVALTVPALLVALVVGVPDVSAAADPPRRIANLDGDYPGLYPSDPEATMRVAMILFPDLEQACYRIRWSGMQVRAVYVYRRSTDVLKTRLYDHAPTTVGYVEGCAESDVPRALLRKYRRHPGRYYVKASSYDGQEQIAGRLRRPRS